MTDAPERIWIEDERTEGGICHVHNEPSEGVLKYGTPYILATPEALANSPEVQALIAAAEARGWDAAIEAAAKLLGKYVDGLIEEYGNHEWDTNVTNLPEWVVTIEEEFETQSAAIRALKKGE